MCLRARAPCPLRVSCPGADRAFVRAAILQAKACSVSCRFLRFGGPLGARHLNILYLSAPPPFSSHISFSRTPFFLCVYLPLRAAYSEGSSRTISLTLTSLPDATKNWRNRSLVIGTMYQAQYTLYVYIHYVHTLGILFIVLDVSHGLVTVMGTSKKVLRSSE